MTAQETQRRLAVVLAADMVGYSRLVEVDEEGTIARLREHRSAFIDPTIAARRGRIVKSTGDGLLAEFASPVEAVRCAAQIQLGMAGRETDIAEERRIRFRIGINLGDIVIEGDDILGDGVNLAARLEGIAEPGGVCLSGAVYEQVNGKVDQGFDDLGHRKVKNIAHSVHVYRLRLADAPVDPASQSLFAFGDRVDRRQVIAGGCLCGAVRYEIDQPAIATGFCHCRICQRFTGAPVGVWTAFPRDAVRFVAGAPKVFMSSAIARRGFCADCGTSLTYQLVKPREEGFLVIFTASLDNPGDFAPTSHGGIESQMPWLDIHDDLPRTRCEESPTLRDAWQSVGVTDPSKWAPGD